MATVDFQLVQTTGKTLYLTFKRGSDDFYYDYSDGLFKALIAVVDEKVPLVEDTGTYQVSVDLTTWIDDEYLISCLDEDYGLPYGVPRVIHTRNGTTLEDDVRDNVVLNENTGGVLNLLYVDPDGNGIAGAIVTVWVSSEYGGAGTSPVGMTATISDGSWREGVGVPPGETYKIVFHKPNYFGPNFAEVVV